MPDISNTTLSKIFSVEVLITVLTGVFLWGLAWAGITQDVQDTNQKVEIVTTEQKQMHGDVAEIKTDIALIKQDQGYLKDQLRNTNKDIERILRLLERNQNTGVR